MIIPFNFPELTIANAHPFILIVMQLTRNHYHDSDPIVVTSTIRSIEEHILIYKKRYGSKWLTKIAWKSGHLARPFDPTCYAIDFLRKEDIIDHLEFSIDRVEAMKIFPHFYYGIGIAKDFIHFDIAPERTRYSRWYYK